VSDRRTPTRHTSDPPPLVNVTVPTIAAVSIALILAPAASADPNDDVFLRNLADAGITHFPHPLVQEGHSSTCHTLDLGPSGGGYVPDMSAVTRRWAVGCARYTGWLAARTRRLQRRKGVAAER
jgi:hypothetical protein